MPRPRYSIEDYKYFCQLAKIPIPLQPTYRVLKTYVTSQSEFIDRYELEIIWSYVKQRRFNAIARKQRL
jgi:hypothetical protein